MNQESGKFETLKKYSLRSTIAFMCISAGLAIVTILFGNFSGFGPELKMLLSTLVISGASICCLCSSAYAGRKGGINFGTVGIVLAPLSALLLTAGIWLEIGSEEYWKFSSILCILAIANAHISVMLAVRLPRKHFWLQAATALSSLLMALTLVSLILAEQLGEDFIRPILALSIVIALESVVIPILGRITKVANGVPAKKTSTLLLYQQDDGLYRDANGRIYRLSPVDTPDIESMQSQG